MKNFYPNQTVAVLPLGAHAAGDVLCLTKISHVGHCLVQTIEGHLYSAPDGMAIKGHNKIVPARLSHRVAIGSQLVASRLAAKLGKSR